MSLGIFWHLDSTALADAERVDRRVARRENPGRLAGVPVAIKDAFDVASMPGGGGGPIRIAKSDAAAVQQLRREGALIVGKVAMHQLGWGMSGQTPGRPMCQNPYAPGRQPGGSSSGSAAAVAAGIVPLALAADSGGSVRVPSAWCGVVGFKPNRAAIPLGGVLPLAPPLDAVGLIGATVEDCLHGDAVLRGSEKPPRVRLTGLRVGVERRLMEQAVPAVRRACEAALERLQFHGVHLRDVELPIRGLTLAPIYAAELAAVWAEEVTQNPRAYGHDVVQGIEAGLAVSAAEYLRALRRLEQVRRDATLTTSVVACPATPILPPSLDAPDDVRTAGRFARTFNALDWPALVVPCGNRTEPVGLQLAAPPGRESILWRLAAALEQDNPGTAIDIPHPEFVEPASTGVTEPKGFVGRPAHPKN
jgi:aspartyl-tRNA(Asn)/glutamyl-tRNA(Gln) amidotransferase subunit A